MAEEIIVLRTQAGRPHAGKVFAAVHARLSDVARYAAGLCAKLMAEGYNGYLIRTTNDEISGGHSMARNILSNEQEHMKMAEVLGFKDVFDLYYRSHRLHDISPIEFRSRLVFILRMLKPDTVLSFHPAGSGESDYDATGQAVDDACRMCGSDSEFGEHREAGIQPHTVRERYYFHVRPEQPYNRVVDTSPYVEKKLDAIVACQSQGGGNLGAELRARLAKQGKRLPLLGDDERTANRAYARQFLLDADREYGRSHKLTYAERFQFIDRRPPGQSKVDAYVEKNAIRI